MSWDPDQHLRFGAERSLPFRHLVSALEHLEPAAVVDLGCGPGGLTATLRELCASDRWNARLAGLPRTGVREPGWYLDELGGRGLTVTVWLTTYHHILPGPDPVLEWVKGSTLRPVLERLDETEQREFTTAYAALLRDAYPEVDGRTSFPFNRLFVVATRQ
jgi:trans-aconitate 2-methyltransferase